MIGSGMELVELRDSWRSDPFSIYYVGFGLTRYPVRIRQFLELRREHNRARGAVAFFVFPSLEETYSSDVRVWPTHGETDSGICFAESRIGFEAERQVYVVCYAYDRLDIADMPEYFYKTITRPCLLPIIYKCGLTRARHGEVLLRSGEP